MNVKAVVKTRHYKAGYVVRHELIDGAEFGGKDFVSVSAYTPGGKYIGNSTWAYRLCKLRGIVPEVRDRKGAGEEDANGGRGFTCSIGLCAREEKWYGWSHRAIYGFGIGSTVKKGDCAYAPATFNAMLEDIRAFHEYNAQDENATTRNVEFIHGSGCVIVRCEKWRPQEVSLPDAAEAIERIDDAGDAPFELLTGPAQWVEEKETYDLGRGEWTAQTMDDAKQMASDFAEGVS